MTLGTVEAPLDTRTILKLRLFDARLINTTITKVVPLDDVDKPSEAPAPDTRTIYYLNPEDAILIDVTKFRVVSSQNTL